MVIDFDQVQVDGPYRVELVTGVPSSAVATGAARGARPGVDGRSGDDPSHPAEPLRLGRQCARRERTGRDPDRDPRRFAPRRSPAAARSASKARRVSGSTCSCRAAAAWTSPASMPICSHRLSPAPAGSGLPARQGRCARRSRAAAIWTAPGFEPTMSISAPTRRARSPSPRCARAKVRANGSGEVAIAGSPACTITGLARRQRALRRANETGSRSRRARRA